MVFSFDKKSMFEYERDGEGDKQTDRHREKNIPLKSKGNLPFSKLILFTLNFFYTIQYA